MSYHDRVGALSQDAERLEQAYREARESGEEGAFKQAIEDSHAQAPENLLYSAWFYRLRETAARVKGYAAAWGWVIPLAVANGLLFWWLSGNRFTLAVEGFEGTRRTFAPAIVLLAGPLSALFALIYRAAAGRKRWIASALAALALLAAGAYVLLVYPVTGTLPFQQQYLTLMAVHLPLLAWAGVGVVLVARHRDPANRFCFLIKSFEAIVLGGLFAIAGGLLTAITVSLFQALNIEFPELVQRMFIAGGAGLIPVVAVAVIYNPSLPPAQQAFDEGLSKLVALLMRIMLPLALLVLAVYLGFIPFNFRAPFENRDVLLAYNGMLFAVIALLVGATPRSQDGLSPRLARWLRAGICAVAALALVVSLYALSAIVYRTILDRLTPNRFVFIGWNVVNIGLLVLVLVHQARAREGRWLEGLYRAFRAGTVGYVAWTVVVILAIPWMFRIDRKEVEALPMSVQRIVSEQPRPIVLKCYASPHIYLLDKGEKRWIQDMATFSERGYVWGDVQFVPCRDLQSIPDGVPIPADAGPPPQP